MMDEIYSYREMCDRENKQTLQRGMNFRLHPEYSVILMSRRSNAPYRDHVKDDGVTIEYEGHDQKRDENINVKNVDQPRYTQNGKLTQNGLFARAVELYKSSRQNSEVVRVYEKLLPGVWSFKGDFNLTDYKIDFDGKRKVFIFILSLAEDQNSSSPVSNGHEDHTRLIPSEIKKEVYKRDDGKCVLCGATKNLHFDHELPFSKGGASITVQNVRILCAKCNLSKSSKIE